MAVTLFEIEHAFDRVNKQRAELKLDPIQSHFTYAFIRLLNEEYQKLSGEDDKNAFYESWNTVLNRIGPHSESMRHGYKQVAGIIFGAHGNNAQARARRFGKHKPEAASKDKKVPPKDLEVGQTRRLHF